MTSRIENYRTALASGDPDEVNSAIEELEEMDSEPKAELFDDAFEMCLDLYEAGDGYQRQSAVRFVRELIPRQHLLAIFKETDDSDLPDHLTLDRMKESVTRLEAFYLTALDDDDGRVRQAAIKGLRNLSVAYQMGGDDERLDDLLATLDEMGAEASGKKREHIEQLRHDVHLRRKGPTLDEIL